MPFAVLRPSRRVSLRSPDGLPVTVVRIGTHDEIKDMVPNGGSPEILVIRDPDDPAGGMSALVGLHDLHAHGAVQRNNSDITVLLHMEMSVHVDLADNDTIDLFLRNLPQKLILLLVVCVNQCSHTFSCHVLISVSPSL